MTPSSKPLIGLLLAAGSSRRFGSNKLLHPLANNIPMAVQAARNLLGAIPTCIAVVRPEDHELKHALAALPLQVIDNPRHAEGMSGSLVCGVRASRDATGWVVALADMPYIPVSVIKQIAQQLNNGAAIVAPMYQGQRGHPVGFAARFREELLQLQGDNGARSLLHRHADQIHPLSADAPEVLIDIDAPTAPTP
jgi:molybdenum cofactor cytidylyltransferase